MNLHENTDFGRKVFFLNPPVNFRHTVIPALFHREYEVYLIDDYRQAKNILRAHPDSMCFVSIDTDLNVDQWFNFVLSFDNDPLLATIFLGIMSSNATKIEREHFLLNAIIPAGFISLTAAKNDLLEILCGIFDLNGAKGQRKYVRADCKSDKMATAQCVINDTSYLLRIKNISSVGVTCGVDPAMAGNFALNARIRNFTLHLRRKKIICNAIITHSIITENEARIVFLFTKGIPHTAKLSIKEYVHTFLQSKIEALAANGEPDKTDYSKKQKIIQAIDDAFLIAVDETES